MAANHCGSHTPSWSCSEPSKAALASPSTQAQAPTQGLAFKANRSLTPLSAPFSEGHLVSTEFGVSQTWVQAWSGFRRDCGDYSSLIRLPCKHGNSE